MQIQRTTGARIFAINWLYTSVQFCLVLQYCAVFTSNRLWRVAVCRQDTENSVGPGHTLPSISEDNEAEEEAEEVEEPPLSPQSPHLRRNGNSRIFWCVCRK